MRSTRSRRCGGVDALGMPGSVESYSSGILVAFGILGIPIR
jgi:hypothetical protein